MLTIGEINFNYVEGEEPQEEIKEVAQEQFGITMTNDILTTDDGTNVEKLVESKKYDGLFNGKEGDADNDFEFKWDLDYNYVNGKLPEYVKLPTTMHFELKDPMVLRDVQILNRKNSNGSVNSLEAEITYTDGSTTEFKDGGFAKKQEVYTLTADNTKKVKSVDITPLTSDGTATGYQGEDAKNRMLTLREINFRYVEGDQKPEVPEVNKADLQAKYDELKGKANDGYTEDSWNAFQKALEGAKAILDNEKATQSEVDAALKALTDANAGLVKPEVPEVNKADLQAKYDELKGKANDGYTEDSWNAFQKALEGAKAVLDKADATQSEVDTALDALVKADAGLTKAENPSPNPDPDDPKPENPDGNGGQDGGNPGNTNKPGSGLPQTGDLAVVAVAGTGIIGSVTAALGAFFHRRRRDQ